MFAFPPLTRPTLSPGGALLCFRRSVDYRFELLQHTTRIRMKLKMCSRRPGRGEVNSACHVAYGELIRLRAENTLSTVDRGHREMISIMKAFNSSAGVEKNRFEKRAVVFCWAPAMMGDACKVCCQLNALSSYINPFLFPRREKKKVFAN